MSLPPWANDPFERLLNAERHYRNGEDYDRRQALIGYDNVVEVSVKTYLVDKGIGESRLETIGYGPDRPVAENSTVVGRQQNRRIEFKMLRQ